MKTSKRKFSEKHQSESPDQPVIPPPLIEQIQKRAFEIYQACGCVDGRDLEHWLKAEIEIKMELELQFEVEQLLKTDSETTSPPFK